MSSNTGSNGKKDILGEVLDLKKNLQKRVVGKKKIVNINKRLCFACGKSQYPVE